jgi:ABC-type transporter Mla subunit MlaD
MPWGEETGMGWMVLFGLLGLFVFGAVIYVAVRLATGGSRRGDRHHHDGGAGGHCC